MKRMQSGFTLIELVVVIVILGILAVTAVPRFIDLSTEAEAAALKGVQGSIESAAAINYAGYASTSGSKGVSVASGDSCDTKIRAIHQSFPAATDYAITGTVGTGLSAGDTDNTCQVEQVSTGATFNPTLIVTN